MVKRERSVSPGRTRGGAKELRGVLKESAREAERQKEEDAARQTQEDAEMEEALRQSALSAAEEEASLEAKFKKDLQSAVNQSREPAKKKRKCNPDKDKDPEMTKACQRSQLEADQKNLIRTDLQRKLRENICLLRDIRGGGWMWVNIARDGNCLFEALAHDLRVHWTQLNWQDQHKLLDGVKKKISDWQQQDQLLVRQDLDSFFNDTKFDQLKLRQLLVTFMKGNP